jgi:glutaredoxin 3
MAKQVKVYTTSYCTFCRRAKDLLRQKAIAFDEIDVTEDAPTREWLVRTTGRRTVPQIFVGETSIGGYEELRALEDDGQLAAMVTDS